MDGVDDQAPGGAVEGGVDPADELVAVEDGQDVVAVAAGGLGDVDLQPELEAEQALGPLAVDDEVVEGREQGRPGLPVAGLEALQQGQVVGVDIPGAGPLGAVVGQADLLDLAGSLEAGQDRAQARVAPGGEAAVDVAGGGDPEGAEAALGGEADDLALGGAPGRGPRGQAALGQVPDPLLARSSSARVGSGPPSRSWRRIERRRAWLSASQARSWVWRADG